MIQANEIRIGNYVASGIIFKETSIIGKVLEIGNLEREFEQIYCECEESFEWFFKNNYCGIPLTEEWLVRCGFEKDKHGFTLKNKYSLSLSIDKNGKIRACFNDRFLTDVPIIQHVHQLQNLYFALTSQELTIKEK